MIREVFWLFIFWLVGWRVRFLRVVCEAILVAVLAAFVFLVYTCENIFD